MEEATPVCLLQDWQNEREKPETNILRNWSTKWEAVHQNWRPWLSSSSWPTSVTSLLIWQPGWERNLGEDGYMCMYSWDPSLSTWNCYNIVKGLWVISCFSCVLLFVTYGLQPSRLLCPWDSPDKNTGVCCHALLQGIILTQGLNSHLLGLPALAGGFFNTSASL